MRLVADDEIPFRRRFQLRLQLVIPGQHVEARDQSMPFGEGISGRGRLDLLPAHDVEAEAELVRQLILPLLDQTSRRDDQATLEAASDQQFFDEQAGHDGLASTRIIGQQEAERLAVQHRPIHRGQLVRQGLDLGRVNGEIGIEEMRHANAKRFRGQAEQSTVAVEREAAARRDLAQPRLVATIENPVAEPFWSSPGHLDCIGPVGTGGDDFHGNVAV